MRLAARFTALALGAALAAAATLAGAQQPAPAQKKAKPAVQSATYYDSYEASRRLPTRGTTCQRGTEDKVGAFCAKACKAGYEPRDNRSNGTRQCRSLKPLPPGVLPASGQKEVAAKPAAAYKPAPKRATKSVP
jgi:hypothetical protein